MRSYELIVAADVMKVLNGADSPLGACYDGQGVNFAIFSTVAERVELCLFDSADAIKESARIDLKKSPHGVWSAYLPKVSVGQVYAYRVYGPYEPKRGQRCNPAKLLLDPYAKVLARPPIYSDLLFDFLKSSSSSEQRLEIDRRDNVSVSPRAAVLGELKPLAAKRPKTSWKDTFIYEAHVKGLTMLHPDVEPKQRGKYLGVCSEPIIEHLQKLGVTAIELLPVHASTSEPHLQEKKLVNYWGYNTLSYFCPDGRYASDGTSLTAITEFRQMVNTLHEAGIEVILDVVYNHTADGNQYGPTYSFRGIDNATYYHLLPGDPSRYWDFTGCGNTLNASNPVVLRLIMDSLRYWVSEMGVDGFRFDLLSASLRREGEVDAGGPLSAAILQDPVLSDVKLIAEPWDACEGGYQVGNLLNGWSEWNGRYRDAVRRYLKGDPGLTGEFATRISGSSDIYRSAGRSSWASINFVSVHDGFPLRDLVSYNDKHNEANLDENRDGENHNNSFNYGAEGPSNDAEILAVRGQQQKNFLATLLLSNGVPMLLAGDELHHTQQGNNNCYCQDNKLSWIDWSRRTDEPNLVSWIKDLVLLRKQAEIFSSGGFFAGELRDGRKDLSWYHPSGREMEGRDWENAELSSIGARFEMAEGIGEFKQLLLLFNAHRSKLRFQLPPVTRPDAWLLRLSSNVDSVFERSRPVLGGEFELAARSVAVLVIKW